MGFQTRFFGFVVAFSIAHGASAASLNSSCYLLDEEGQKVEGVNVDKRFEIASVSKIVTGYWAVKKMGSEGRYTTAIYVKKVAPNLYDLHLYGSRDPSAGHEQLQFIAGQLNELGIRKVRNLTFDERFKFIRALRAGSTATGHYNNNDPSPDRVMYELRSSIKNLDEGYESTREKAKSKFGMILPKDISLQVNDIHFLGRESFDPKSFETAYLYKSAPVRSIIKEMNRNSNNHIANVMFESLGGAEAFHTFIDADLKMDRSQIRFVNGSGDRKDTEEGALYNEATCRALLTITKSFAVELKKTNRNLQDVLAVAGDDAAGETSTVSKLYDNDSTHDALAAKTGTVNPAVTLAGRLSTEEGEVYFGVIMGTKGSSADWRAGRGKIRSILISLSDKFGGPKELNYSAPRFIAFDKESVFKKLEAGGPK